MTEEKVKKTGKKKSDSLETIKTGNDETEMMKEDVNTDEDTNKEIEEAMADDTKTAVRAMPMIPLRGLSIFPYMVLHFDIGREKSISALEKAMMMNQLVFLSAQKDAETDLPTHEDFIKSEPLQK